MSHIRAYEEFSPLWYGVLILLATLLFSLSMGGGLFALDSDHWYHKMSLMAFDSLCHQQHERSLSLNGVVMAVCSRCLGIYGSFFAGLVIFPTLIPKMLAYQRSWAIKMILTTLVFIVIDFVGNLAGVWMNTHQSRIIIGGIFGLSLAWLLAGEFKQKPNLQVHGTN